MLTEHQLATLLVKAAEGDPWYGSSTLRVLEGLSAAQAAARPFEGAHSIWELVLHMTAWAAEVERRLAGAQPALPSDGDWPEVADTSDEAWSTIVEGLRVAVRRLGEQVRELPARRWDEVVGGARAPELGTGVTYAEMVAGILQHNAYHTGQIALLRKLVSARGDHG